MGLSLDIADEGGDRNAACISRGFEVVRSEEWSGKGGDIFETVECAFELCDEYSLGGFDYDMDGLGAGARGDARKINEARRTRGERLLDAVGWRGSEVPHDPDGIVEGTIGSAGDQGRTNKDYFANRKAQGWWALRRRFEMTHRWIKEGVPCNPDEIISISSKCPNHRKLLSELSQPTYQVNGTGKIVINKRPAQTKSPNLADAVMMRFAPKKAPRVQYTMKMVEEVRRTPKYRRPWATIRWG